MGNFLLRRLLLLIPVLWGVATLVFLLLHFIPGDPVDLMLGDSALGTDRETLRDQMGLNDPLIVQYLRYFGDLLQGDWGTSLFSKKPVFEEIMERVPATMELMLGAMVVTILVAMPLGLIAAVNKGTWIDQGAMIFSLLGVSIPNFWLGPMLILLFSIHFDLLPVNERGGLEHLILPALTLGTSLASILARITRSSVVETLQHCRLHMAAGSVAELNPHAPRAVSNRTDVDLD